MIDTLLNRLRRKRAIINSTALSPILVPNQKWMKLPFFSKLSLKINKCIPNNKFKVCFYNSRTLDKLLFNSKDRYLNCDKSGVYMLNCDTPGCNCFYVGQTGRKITTRTTEHFKSFVHFNNKSMFSTHLIDNDHSSDFNPKLLHACDKGKKLDFIENFEILSFLKIYKNDVLNDLIPSNTSPFYTVPVRPPPPP